MHADRPIKPSPELRELIVRDIVRRRGLVLERHGQAWHIHGQNVDVRVVDLSRLTAADLEPA